MQVTLLKDHSTNRDLSLYTNPHISCVKLDFASDYQMLTLLADPEALDPPVARHRSPRLLQLSVEKSSPVIASHCEKKKRKVNGSNKQ